jgi:transcriptional regulator with XRE-family HTH domain
MTIEQIRLKETRIQKEMTQEQVAQALGVSQQAYQKLETGKTTDMRISTVKKICTLFNISADWLLGLKE